MVCSPMAVFGLVGAADKPVALSSLCRKLGVQTKHTVFLGDDLNDLALKGTDGVTATTEVGA